jgi:hypothetical protein
MRLLTALLLLAPLFLVAACDDDDDSGLSPSAQTTMAEGAAATPTLDPYSTPTPLPPTREIVLDRAPFLRPQATTAALQGPDLEFAPPDWRGGAAAVYDMQTGEQIELGTGSIPNFMDGAKAAVWIEHPGTPGSGTAWIIDLPSGQRRALGAADRISIESQQTVRLWTGQTPGPTFNLSGTPFALSPSRTRLPYTPSPPNEISGPEGYRLFAYWEGWDARYVVTTSSGAPLVEFRAGRATPFGDDLLVATAPSPVTPETEILTQPVDIYLVDLPTGDVTFLATAEYDASLRGLSGDGRYAIWSEGFCTSTPLATYIYDVMSGSLARLDAALRVYPRGDGLFNGVIGEIEGFDSVVFDPETLTLRARFDGYVPQMAWSDDWRYAASGRPAPKGGGPCGI